MRKRLDLGEAPDYDGSFDIFQLRHYLENHNICNTFKFLLDSSKVKVMYLFSFKYIITY